ncbi:paraslipin [candidate division KSB1 bacterium]|nr:paraslipin [candidate division KSB1 bacterium]
MTSGTIVLIILAFVVVIAILKTATVVPQRSAFIVERLGKYSKTLQAGFHILVPFLDRISYKHTLKEEALDVPPQSCITRDNVVVEVDGILYLQLMDPVKASYGITNYRWATIQLSQTTMRSLIGKLELDRTFEERETLNAGIVSAVDKASEPWGVKVTRYEVKNIKPPETILEAMEKQMRAEREKRATIATSEGQRQSEINMAEGERAAAIARSEGEKQRLINEATGRAQATELDARATATAFREIANALQTEGGREALNLRVAEKYIHEFGNLAKANNTMILPSNLADVASFVAAATKAMAVMETPKR